MIRLCIGFVAGIATVLFYPEVLDWFTTSGMRDELIERLKEL